MKSLDGLSWKPRWVTTLGCFEGCLDYLGADVPPEWVFGASGHAFVMNIAPDLCPSGPTAWDSQRFGALRQNAGSRVDTIVGYKSQPDFRDKQKQAWETVRRAIDAGTPCFGWELAIPEYYMITGYDDTGYYFQGPLCHSGAGPKAWDALGDTAIQVLEVSTVTLASPPEDRDVVREALQFALAWGDPDNPWRFRNYATGLEAYDMWARGLRSGKAHGLGSAYNAQVWAECRQYALRFLESVRSRLGASDALDEAVTRYGAVTEHLTTVANTFPFDKTTDEEKDRNARDPDRCEKGATALETARPEEAKGLEALRGVLASL